MSERKVNRDARTGEFVNDETVLADPEHTVTETVHVSSNKPFVGRIVHYVSYGTPNGEHTSECRAAVVTEVVSDDEVGLAVLNPTGFFFNRGLLYDEKAAGGTWHWPERV